MQPSRDDDSQSNKVRSIFRVLKPSSPGNIKIKKKKSISKMFVFTFDFLYTGVFWKCIAGQLKMVYAVCRHQPPKWWTAQRRNEDTAGNDRSTLYAGRGPWRPLEVGWRCIRRVYKCLGAKNSRAFFFIFRKRSAWATGRLKRECAIDVHPCVCAVRLNVCQQPRYYHDRDRWDDN